MTRVGSQRHSKKKEEKNKYIYIYGPVSKQNRVFSLFSVFVCGNRSLRILSPYGILFFSYQDYISYITVE